MSDEQSPPISTVGLLSFLRTFTPLLALPRWFASAEVDKARQGSSVQFRADEEATQTLF